MKIIHQAPAAAGGLLDRRAMLGGGALAAGVAVAGTGAAEVSIAAGSPTVMTRPGGPFTGYGLPSHWRKDVQRLLPNAPGRPGTGTSRTPLERLEGTLTPNGLHFERHHNGVPDIDPEQHRLLIHGLVRQPLNFSLEALLRYPMETHVRFIECAGNSGGMIAPQIAQTGAGGLHGLLSCAEWTGVKLSTLLDEAGIDPRARWVIAEGSDSAGMSRSIPLWKCLDDAVIALFQNGEAIRPEQGFPMRLLLPGFQGNTNVKWLRRLKLAEGPVYARDETSKYSQLLADGRTRVFPLEMHVKSLILKPSPGLTLQGPGEYEISGLAWSGLGRIRRVDVSADGGRSWAQAALATPILPKALTRFRLPWRWDGSPLNLISRATDEFGEVQPAHAKWSAQFAPGQSYHYNAICGWAVDSAGVVSSVRV
jgi:sulfane dehydrogenase subunit SoxC